MCFYSAEEFAATITEIVKQSNSIAESAYKNARDIEGLAENILKLE